MEALQKQLGPFKLWQWIIIAIAGISLGLVVKKRFGGGTATPDFSGVAAVSNPDAGELGTAQSEALQDLQQTHQEDFDTVQESVQDLDRFDEEFLYIDDVLQEILEADETVPEDAFTPVVDAPVVEARPTESAPAPAPTIVAEPVDSPTTPTQEQAPSGFNYVVVSGDTLWKIATRFKVIDPDTGKVHWQPIYEANPIITNPDLIRVGWTLWIPQ